MYLVEDMKDLYQIKVCFSNEGFDLPLKEEKPLDDPKKKRGWKMTDRQGRDRTKMYRFTRPSSVESGAGEFGWTKWWPEI